MWQRQQQVGSHMACAPFVNLVEWKIWKRHTRVCWTKITVIYNSRNVYQTKGIQPWSKSLKRVQFWVIEKSYNCAPARCSCNDRRCRGQNYFRQKLYHHSRLLRLPRHQFELNMWSWLLASFRVRDRKYLSVGFIFRIYEATLMVPRGW